MIVASTIYHFIFSQMEYMGSLDCELLDRSVGLAEFDVIFKSRTLDYMTPTCDGEKKLRQHIQLHIGAYPFFAVFVMWTHDGRNGEAAALVPRGHPAIEFSKRPNHLNHLNHPGMSEHMPNTNRDKHRT